MKSRHIVTLAAVCSVWSLAAYADRDTGWEFGGELIYQDSTEFTAERDAAASLDSDLGIALTFGYRFNEKLELTFGVDWNNIDYDATVVADGVPLIPNGTITPYISGMIGYAFIDTNIPNGPPQTGCWWDPWYGQICGSWQPTRSADNFVYGAGLGVRWDVNDAWSLRFGYDKRWIDSNGSPDVDQIKLGVSVMY